MSVKGALLVLLGLLCVLVAPRLAWAGTDTKASVDADVIEVGGTVHLSLQTSTTSTELQFTEPEPGAHAGFTVMGTTASPTQTISIVNGVTTQKRGVAVTWTLRADRTGTFDLGPPSIRLGGKKLSGQAPKVAVVGRGKLPRKQGWDPSPFDPWKGLFGLGQDDPFKDPFHDVEIEPPTNPQLSLDAPRGVGTFLHATIDKTRAVVGEQVTHAVYMYVDTGQAEHDFNDVHEATAADFVKRTLLEGEREPKTLGHAKVADRIYVVKLVRKAALFPLKAGALEVGPMKMALVRTRGADGARESETLTVDVTEPRLAGRPPGYNVGDVGIFALSANVTPREVERGGAVSVTVELSGVGNLPSVLPLPIRSGVEWLDPQTSEKVGAVSNDRFGGKRTFSYLVRMKREGEIDLGWIEIPYYDPQKTLYETARASLGAVRVTRSASVTPEATPDEVLPGLPAPSTTREPIAPTRAYVTTRWTYWAGLGVGPAAFLLARLLHGAMAMNTRRRREKEGLAETYLKRKAGKIKEALAKDEPDAVLAAVENAVFAAAEVACGASVRGQERSSVPAILVEAGVSEETAREVVLVLAAGEEMRFVPGAATAKSAKELSERAKRVIAALEKKGRRR